MKFRHILLVWVVALLLPSAAVGQEDVPMKIKRLIDELNYQKAQRICAKELAKGGLGYFELMEIYRLCGELAAASGKKQEASRLFKLLLAISPNAKLREGRSPKILEQYQEAVRFFKNLPPLKIDVQTPPAPRPGAPLKIVVRVYSDHLKMVKGVTVFYREVGGDRSYKKTGAMGASPLVVTIPSQTAGKFEYYLLAVGPHGCVAEVGGADNPFSFPIVAPKLEESRHMAVGKVEKQKEEEDGGFYQKWWFWTVVGAGLVVVGGVTYLLIADDGPEFRPSDLGQRPLPLIFGTR